MNIRKTSLFVIAAFSVVIVSNSFAQGYSGRHGRPSHNAARLHDEMRALERLQAKKAQEEKQRLDSGSDFTASLESQLIVTTLTPDSIAPVIITQIDDLMINSTPSSLELYDVEPGVHAIVVALRSDPTNGERVTIDVKPGVRYYIGWHESEPAIWREEAN